MKVVNERSIAAVVKATARTSAAVRPLAGCGKPHLIDAVGSGCLAAQIQRFFTEVECEMAVCEGLKDKAPHIAEGAILGKGTLRAVAIADPVECTTPLADWNGSAQVRGSMSVLALAPVGTIPKLYSGCRALKLVLPPGVPTGPRHVSLDSSPVEIIVAVCNSYSCHPSDVTVWVLDRAWNRNAIAEFECAGATVCRIPAGDFEAHLLAASPVTASGKPHVSFGIGGLPEGVAAVPHVMMHGASLLLRPDPLRMHIDEIRNAGCEAMLDRDFDARQLIASEDGDCLVAVAGVTESSVVRGARINGNTHSVAVQVAVASPQFQSTRIFEVDVEIDIQVSERGAA